MLFLLNNWRILAVLMAVVSILGLIGTGVYKVKKWGGDEVRAEWAAANAAAQQEADRVRKAQEATREKLDQEQARRLKDAQKRARTLENDLSAALKATPIPDCRVSDGLRDIANRALSGGEGQGSGGVPRKPQPPPPTR